MTKTVIAANTAANANQTGTVIERQFNEAVINMKVKCAGFNAADATIEIQESDDEVTWFTNDSSRAIAAGASNFIVSINALGSRFYKAVFTKNTNSAGTITADMNITK
jgi:hypothetical protein